MKGNASFPSSAIATSKVQNYYANKTGMDGRQTESERSIQQRIREAHILYMKQDVSNSAPYSRIRRLQNGLLIVKGESYLTGFFD
jgi:hypothetical protein